MLFLRFLVASFVFLVSLFFFVFSLVFLGFSAILFKVDSLEATLKLVPNDIRLSGKMFCAVMKINTKRIEYILDFIIDSSLYCRSDKFKPCIDTTN